MATNDSARAGVLVLGGSGMLGAAVVARLRAAGQPVAAPSRAELDVMDLAGLERFVTVREPEVVINAAAFTDVAQAESAAHREEAWRLNRDVPGLLARISGARGIRLVHVSTDYVFDGRQHVPYVEDDEPAPLQAYGQSKLDGERAVLEQDSAALVIRTSTLFGPARRRRPHYVDAILQQARHVPAVEVVRLPVSSPTYAPDLAAGLLELLAGRARGLVHVVNAGIASRFDLALEAVRAAGLAVEVRERPADPGTLQRPAYSVLDTSHYARLTGSRLRPWPEAVREYVEVYAR